MVAFAWLGGVAFVAALAYLAYFYAVVLAVPAPAGIGIGIARAMVIDVVLFVALQRVTRCPPVLAPSGG